MQALIIVRPPRPEFSLNIVKGTGASRRAPADEVFSLANQLRSWGFSVDVLDCDTDGMNSFIKSLRKARLKTRCLAFFIQAYRLPAAQKVLACLKGELEDVSKLAFGYLSAEMKEMDLGFDEIFLGPAWAARLGKFLLSRGLKSNKALPPIFSFSNFETLTGDAGPAINIRAPSQGCFHRCTFCDHQILKGYGDESKAWLAARKVPDVIEEIKTGIQAGVTNLVFLETNFLNYPKWTQEFIEAFKKEFEYIPFAIHTRLSDISLAHKKGLLTQLKSIGLKTVCSGLESAVNVILKNIRKDATVEEYIEGDALLREHGIKRAYHIVLGLPEETKETLEITWAFVKSLEPDDVQVSIAVPFPGTPLHKQAVDNNWLRSKNLNEYYYYGSAVMEAGDLTREELLSYQQVIYKDLISLKKHKEIEV